MGNFSKPSTQTNLFLFLIDFARLFPQQIIMHNIILTKNLTVEDDNNHITCTQIFLDNSPWEKPGGKTSATNMEIFLFSKKI
jgi:hypothetical protein